MKKDDIMPGDKDNTESYHKNYKNELSSLNASEWEVKKINRKT